MISKLFKKFIKDRNLSSSTEKGYYSALKSYSDFHEVTLEELIEEAQFDENELIPLKERRLKGRLLQYRNYLLKNSESSNTIKTYFTKVKTFYTHYEVELPVLPDVKYRKEYETNYYDLPTKDHIGLVIDKYDILIRSIVLFMSSSGTAKAETLSLTVEDWVKGCKDYYNNTITDLNIIINELNKKKDIVPTLYLRRIKTDKYYYTFCTPEASKEINKYLQTRKNLKLTDPLFDIKPSTLLTRFQEINDENGWGFKGKYRFFRSHALRKFHASNIGISAEYIDALQGRSKNQIHSTYIKTNPSKLRKIYMDNMGNVMIKDEEKEIKQDFTIVINVFLSGKEYNIL